MRIRAVRDEDYAAIARLHRGTTRAILAQHYPPEVVQEWIQRSKADRYRSNAHLCKRFVAVEDNTIIGFADHSFEGVLWGLYVHKDHLGKGVGSKLLKHIENSMKKMGLKKSKIEGAAINAKPFYEGQGYKLLGKTTKKVNEHKYTAYRMEKKLH